MFYAPKSYNELRPLLADKDDNTFFIAGGTDLIIKLENSKLTDYNIIDLTKISEWAGVSELDDYICIGALTTASELCESEIIKSKYSALYLSAYELGSELIRNRATLGGNIGNASQSADMVLALFSLDAKIVVLNSKGEEKILPISQVVVGRNKTCLESDEVISKILLKKDIGKNSFGKVGARKAVTISKVSCAASFDFENDLVKTANIYFGAVGTKPVKAEMLENFILNKSLAAIDKNISMKLAFDEIEKAIPDRSSKYYKREAVKGVVLAVIKDLCKNDWL